MSKKRSIQVVFFRTLLIMCSLFPFRQPLFGQDTLYVNDENLDAPIVYGARDSIFADLRKNQVHLYGEAHVTYDNVDLKAGYILIDLDKNEVLATYRYDKDSNKVEMPVFTSDQEEVKASAISYNFKTEKAFIRDVRTRQDEFYLYMETAKKQANDEIHFRHGRFTTCDLEEPHYHFQLSKAVLVPEKRIASGPMNLWLKGVPTPIGLPFALIPQQKERNKGLIFPNVVPLSAYGFGFQDLGYYVPINDSLQTTFYGTLYSRGSFGIRNKTEYMIRYRFSGDLDLKYERFRPGFPDTFSLNKFSVYWTHRQDAKASPYWTFNSNVNFQSDSDPKNSTDPLNPQYFNNTIYSDVNVRRNFPGKPFTAGAKLSVRQNSQAHSVTLNSPTINFNMTRVQPFKNLIKDGWPILRQFSFTYNFEGKNTSTFGDSLLRNGQFDAIGKRFVNGFRNNSVVQTTAGIFGNTVKINPQLNYTNAINFQQTRLRYDPTINNSVADTLYTPGFSQNLSASLNVTTVFYNYYRYIGKRKPLVRHIATPTVGFTYVPKLTNNLRDSVGPNMDVVEYSQYQRSAYNLGVSREQALLTFGVNNTFELKRISQKDSSGFKKTRLVDQFSVSGSYDFLKDTMQLSNILVNLRISPVKYLNFVSTSNFSPYATNDSTGAILNDYALTKEGRLGRFLNSNLTTTLTLTSPESRKKIEENKEIFTNVWDSDYQYFAMHPERAIDFDIPWKINLSHVYSFTANTNRSDLNPNRYNSVQTLALNGDLSFTRRWKVVATMNFDFRTAKLTYTRFALTRDMHCWALDFTWTPLGGNQSFLFRLRATSALFQNAKINFTKPPIFF